MLYDIQILKVSLFFLLSCCLSTILLVVAALVNISVPDLEKLEAYECGFNPYEDARNSFDIRFYILALLFLVFDLEIVFFLPWGVNISFLSLLGFSGFCDFLFELVIGYIYVWFIGALEWDTLNLA